MTKKESIFSIDPIKRRLFEHRFFSPFIVLALFPNFSSLKKKRGKNIIATRKRENDENDRRIFFRIAGRNDRNDYLGGKKAKRKRSGKWRAKR